MTDCYCTRPVRDGYTLCDTCRQGLENHLADMGWLDDQIETSLARIKAAAGEGGSRSATTPLPWHEQAARVRTDLKNTLIGWVRILHAEKVRPPRHDACRWRPGDKTCGTCHADLPSDTLPALAAWLLGRTDGIAKRDDGWEIVDEITYASQEVRAVVFFKPPQRIYLGPCEGRIHEGGHYDATGEVWISEEPTEVFCDGDVYAEENADLGECDQCLRAYEVAKQKAAIDKRMADQLMTPAEIATAALRLGADLPNATRSKVRNIVAVWDKRKRITQHSRDKDGNPLYRYGDVRDLLYETYAERSQEPA